ncbi:MAG: hypothetical protein Q4A70_01155 [Candidatus Saccharibacteria bacterium]|nr:hypothetical protein [Candidatus Saccharibacteria bacterium]
MVSFKADKRKTISHNIDWLFVILFLIFVISVTLVICVLCFDKKVAPAVDNPDAPEVIEEEVVEDVEVEPVLPERIVFQGLVDEWVDGVSGNRSVLIYDLERDEVVGSYNPDESYNTASLYKLFVVYEGYRKLQAREWLSDDVAGRTGHTIIECLDLAIRESHSECAETLWSMMGREYLGDVIVNNYGIVNSNIGGLTSNPRDITKMLQIFYEHSDIIDESLLARMKDSFLIQPTTIYNWRQGLPSGFSRANVYNKVGWDFNPDGNYWNIYHDAAIVEFPESNRHFIIVIMTNRVPFQRIRDFGSKFEAQFYGE